MSKSNKNTKTQAKTKAPSVSETFTRLFARAGGRFVGIKTVNAKGKVTAYNGQIKSRSDNFVTVNDFISKGLRKIAKNTILEVSGIAK